MKIFVADIGNSYTKTAIWQNSKLYSVKQVPTSNLKSSNPITDLPSAASCVVPLLQKKFSSQIKLWITANLVPEINFVRINKQKIGADRAAAAYAAIHNYPAQNLIIVHCGTAIVIDLVSKNCEFLGGAIFPGLSIMANALHQYTAKLPLLDISKLKRKVLPYGKNTNSAIAAGLKYGSIGVINELLKKMATEAKFEKYLTIFTGGNANLFLEFFPDVIYIKNLVLLGTALIAEKFYESKNLRNSQR